MILLLFGINLMMAALLALTFRHVLATSFGHSMSSEQLLRGFDFTVVADLLKVHGAKVGVLVSQTFWVALLYIGINVFLPGGILGSIINEREPFTLGSFFGSCGFYFFRFLRLFALLAVLLLATGLILGLILAVIYGLLTSHAKSETGPIILFFVLAVVFAIPMLVLLLAGDYAKIGIVLEDQRRATRAFRQSLAFVVRNFPRVLGLQVALFGVLAVLVVVYLTVAHVIGTSTLLGIAVVFLLQQSFVCGRVWTRVLTFAGENELMQKIAPHPALTPTATVEIPVETTVAAEVMSVTSAPEESREEQIVPEPREKKKRIKKVTKRGGHTTRRRRRM